MKNTRKDQNRKLYHRPIDRFTARVIIGARGASRKIALLTGYSKGHVSDIIHGRRRPTDRFLDAMVEAIVADADQRQTAVIQSRYASHLGEKLNDDGAANR